MRWWDISGIKRVLKRGHPDIGFEIRIKFLVELKEMGLTEAVAGTAFHSDCQTEGPNVQKTAEAFDRLTTASTVKN